MAARGQRIEGSYFYRWYCNDCGRAVRVDKDNKERLEKNPSERFYCERCGGRERAIPPIGEAMVPWQLEKMP